MRGALTAPHRTGRALSALVLGVALAAALSGCASDRPKPTPLEGLAGQPVLSVAWSVKSAPVDFPIQAPVAAGRLATADNDGVVVVRRADSGAEVWRAAAGAGLSAGVGFDGAVAAVVTRQNEVVALKEGRVLWRKRLNSRVSTPPLVAGERVFVIGVDRAVDAFDAIDGRYLWRYARTSDALTLAQAGVLTAFKDTLLVGQGARLTALDPTRGTVRWEVALATPRGTNEIERLSDLVGPAARVGDVVCARSFQSAVACVDAERATLRWSRNVGGTDALTADTRVAVAADGSDRVSAWRLATGELAWSHERLLHRGLGAAGSDGRVAVFGDAQGYVHAFSLEDGRTVARGETDGSAIVGAPTVHEGRVIVVTRKGGLFALRLP